MKIYKKDDNSRGGKSSGGRSFDGRRGEKENKTYKAVCSNCGAGCTVPFKPNGKKPVLCSPCLSKGGNGDRDSKRSENPGMRRINDAEKVMYSATCSECGKSCGLPFKPNGKKPVLCSLCFAQSTEGKTDGASTRPGKDKLDMINEKLDKILKMLYDELN